MDQARERGVIRSTERGKRQPAMRPAWPGSRLAAPCPNQPDRQRDEQEEPPEVAEFAGRHLDEAQRARKQKQQPQADEHPESKLEQGARARIQRLRGSGAVRAGRLVAGAVWRLS